MEKKYRPDLETASLFKRSVLRMKMRSEVRRAMRGDQTAAAMETTTIAIIVARGEQSDFE